MVVGEAEGGSHTTKLENYFVVPLALRMPIYSNFQINGASEETLKPPDPRFLKQNRGSGDFRVSPEVSFICKLI